MDAEPTTAGLAAEHDGLALALFVGNPRQPGADRVGEHGDVMGDEVHARLEGLAGEHPESVAFPLGPQSLVGRAVREDRGLGMEEERRLGCEPVEVPAGVVGAEGGDEIGCGAQHGVSEIVGHAGSVVRKDDGATGKTRSTRIARLAPISGLINGNGVRARLTAAWKKVGVILDSNRANTQDRELDHHGKRERQLGYRVGSVRSSVPQSPALRPPSRLPRP